MTKRTAGAPKSARDTRAEPVAAMAFLLLLAVWLAPIPYVGARFGYDVDVPAKVEVVDHVVPAVVIAAVVVTTLLFRRRQASRWAFAVGAAVCLLAGLWATSTHVPLLIQAGQGHVSWGAALFHSAPGPVIMAVSLFALLRALPALD